MISDLSKLNCVKSTLSKLFSILTPIDVILGTINCFLLNSSVAKTSILLMYFSISFFKNSKIFLSSTNINLLLTTSKTNPESLNISKIIDSSTIFLEILSSIFSKGLNSKSSYENFISANTYPFLS